MLPPKGPLRGGDFKALGTRPIEANNLDSAVFVFERNVELYPGSWKAWDSLGEVSAKAGRKERAIESYRTSLELKPGQQEKPGDAGAAGERAVARLAARPPQEDP